MKSVLKRITGLLLVFVVTIVLVSCKATFYTVDFDLNGGAGEIASQEIAKDGLVKKPTDPTRVEYDFAGWYSDQSLGNEYVWVFSLSVVTKDTTLYAKWIKTDDNGGGDPTFVIPDLPDLSVRNATGGNGMVATASSYATDVGVAILEAGGNAFDAAVAIGFALGVVEPNASGIGGGGFMVAYNKATNERLSYNYREFAPEMSDRSLYQAAGLGGILELGDGAGSFGVPMLVDGLITVLEENGTMSLEDVLTPAINLAEHGFPITKSLAAAISDNFNKLMRPTAINEALAIYTDGLMPLKEGDLLINKNLAKVLRKIADEGKSGFYEGDVARAIVNSISQGGSVVSLDDFFNAIGRTEGFQAQTPVTGTYKDYEIISMAPPSSGGATLIEIFNMLEIYDEELEGGIPGLGHNTAEYIHMVGSLSQLAFGDRRKYIGDPNFVDVPVNGLISKEYAALRLEHFDPLVGQTIGAEYGDPWAYDNLPLGMLYEGADQSHEDMGTTHFSIVDKFGNVVSATHTINYFFGNGYMPDGTGIHLNNIMSPFSVNVSSVNLIEPFKVPLSNMSPVIVLKDGEPFMSVGSPGSMRITSAVVQTMLNIIEFGMDIQTAIESPRVHHYVGSRMEIEGAIGNDVIEGLIALGYNPSVYSGKDLYFGGVQGVLIDMKNNLLHGGADIRRDGKAGGY